MRLQQTRRSGLTLFQLLVVLALFAILLGLLLPATQKVREAAARAQSMNNLKMLCLSIHNYASAYRNVLVAGDDDNHFSATSRLLPFIELERVYKQIDFKKSVDDDANAEAKKTVIKYLLNPADPIQQVKPAWGATNYVFNQMVFSEKPKFNIGNIPDGTSNTIFVGETLKGDGENKERSVARKYVLLDKKELKDVTADTGVDYFKDGKNMSGERCASWMDGRFLMGTCNGQLQPNDTRPDVSCGGAGGVSGLRSLAKIVNVALGDGSARSVSVAISKPTWQNAFDPADGQPLGSDW